MQMSPPRLINLKSRVGILYRMNASDDVSCIAKTVGKSNCTARKSARAPKGYSQLGVPDKGIVDNKYHLIGREND